jgi:hypothetical protein
VAAGFRFINFLNGPAAVRVANPTREHDGWETPHTVVEIVTDDTPFLVDSVSVALVSRAYDIHVLLHPRVDQTAYLHLEIDRETDPGLLAELQSMLENVVADVHVVVGDWRERRTQHGARKLAFVEASRQVTFAEEWFNASKLIAPDAEQQAAARAQAWLDEASDLVAESKPQPPDEEVRRATARGSRPYRSRRQRQPPPSRTIPRQPKPKASSHHRLIPVGQETRLPARLVRQVRRCACH